MRDEHSATVHPPAAAQSGESVGHPAGAVSGHTPREPLRVLLIEDSPDDAFLLIRQLQRARYEPRWRRVDTLREIEGALAQEAWDIVIADYSLRGFSALEALELVADHGLDLPFIIVSGAIGEETAVAAMRAGASDYLMKDNLTRLAPAIARERREAQARRRAAAALRRSEEALRQHSRDLERLLAVRTARIRELERQRMAIERLAANGRMAARIAHEINNPLAGIQNSFALIADAIPPDHRYADYVPRIRSEIRRIAHIVRQMFDLYRPEQEQASEMRIADAVHDILSLLQGKCRRGDVRLAARLPSAPVTVDLPRNALFQVLFNVLQNAIEASPPGATVRISVRATPARLTFKVSDQGPGIPRDVRQHIFEPFFTTKSGEPKGGGLGLGLSISHEIVASLGGEIDFSCPPGRGTVCRIRLPRTEPRTTTAERPAARSA